MLQPAIDTLEAAGAPYEILPDGLDPEEVARRAADAEVIIAAYLQLPRSAIQLLRRVGLIVRCGVGVDAIDVAAATEHGVWVANVPDYGIQEVADHA
ncbi:MAG: C-terminal binding protein, partial [Candidatus Dormibacteraeota bacterium]|nr:C-terminal binding protein [Candidatus Dormibacteraeota bacterium]